MKSAKRVFAKAGIVLVSLCSSAAWAQPTGNSVVEDHEASLSFNLERGVAGGDCRLNENVFVQAQGNTLLLRTKDVGFDLMGKGTRRVSCSFVLPVTLPEGFELASVQQDVTYWSRKSPGSSLNGTVAFTSGFANRLAPPVVVDLGEAAIEGTSFFKNSFAPLASSPSRCSSVRETTARITLVLSAIASQDSDQLQLWWRSDDVQKFNFALAPCEL